jgi:hypothetical protein
MYGNEFLILLDVTQHSLVAIYTSFGVIFCHHLQGKNVCEVLDVRRQHKKAHNLILTVSVTSDLGNVRIERQF